MKSMTQGFCNWFLLSHHIGPSWHTTIMLLGYLYLCLTWPDASIIFKPMCATTPPKPIRLAHAWHASWLDGFEYYKWHHNQARRNAKCEAQNKSRRPNGLQVLLMIIRKVFKCVKKLWLCKKIHLPDKAKSEVLKHISGSPWGRLTSKYSLLSI